MERRTRQDSEQDCGANKRGGFHSGSDSMLECCPNARIPALTSIKGVVVGILAGSPPLQFTINP
jgi:hypothetical protein